jgi:hypothetical protein
MGQRKREAQRRGRGVFLSSFIFKTVFANWFETFSNKNYNFEYREGGIICKHCQTFLYQNKNSLFVRVLLKEREGKVLFNHMRGERK